MTKWIIGGVVAVLVIGGGILFATNNKKTPAPTTTATTPSSQTTTNNSSNTDQTVAATITYSNSGFSPATTTVKSGDTVAITNTSSGTLQFDSDPHPEHTDDVDLNVGVVAPGETKTFVVTKTGSHGFHNHLNSSHTATIVVQ